MKVQSYISQGEIPDKDPLNIYQETVNLRNRRVLHIPRENNPVRPQTQMNEYLSTSHYNGIKKVQIKNQMSEKAFENQVVTIRDKMKKFNRNHEENYNTGKILLFNDVIQITNGIRRNDPRNYSFDNKQNKKSIDLTVQFQDEQNDYQDTKETLKIDQHFSKKDIIRKNCNVKIQNVNNYFHTRSNSQNWQKHPQVDRRSTQIQTHNISANLDTLGKKSKSQSHIQQFGPYMNVCQSIDQGSMINAQKYYGTSPHISPIISQNHLQKNVKFSGHNYANRIDTIRNITQNLIKPPESINIHSFLRKVNRIIHVNESTYMNKRKLASRNPSGISSEMQELQLNLKRKEKTNKPKEEKKLMLQSEQIKPVIKQNNNKKMTIQKTALKKAININADLF